MPTDATHQYLERVVDLLDPAANHILNLTDDEARARLLHGPPEAVRDIDGSFALVAREGKRVRLARSMDRPLRYFLAKRAEGPALVVADRIDAIHAWLKSEGLERQFHPSYTRMVPAHYIVELQLIGCPDPDPVYTRYFTPQRNKLSTDLTDMSVEKLYSLKGDIVSRGVKAVTGLDLPVFPKRRFQHGAMRVESLRQRVPDREAELRKEFLSLYA